MAIRCLVEIRISASCIFGALWVFVVVFFSSDWCDHRFRHFQWQNLFNHVDFNKIRRIEMFHRLSISKLSKPAAHFTRDQQKKNWKKERTNWLQRKAEKNQYPIKNVEPFITCENMCAFHWIFFFFNFFNFQFLIGICSIKIL